jgi:DNA-binding MarR family transcriptional regulator
LARIQTAQPDSMSAPFLRTVRSLATAYQAFEAYGAAHVRSLGLTPPQFDVVATLGNTPGMGCRELGERTLITKGTLTGVLDRLEARGLITRTPGSEDRRSVFVGLTAEGDALFRRVFPEHVSYLQEAFKGFDQGDLDELEALLNRLATSFAAAHGEARPATPKERMIAAARSTPEPLA